MYVFIAWIFSKVTEAIALVTTNVLSNTVTY